MRHLGLALPGRGGVAAFINKALTPPGVVALDNALTLLTRIGAFRSNESLTPLVSRCCWRHHGCCCWWWCWYQSVSALILALVEVMGSRTLASM